MLSNMTDSQKPRYYGPNEVSGVVILDYKTPNGGEIVKVIYSADKLPPEIVPMKVFEKVVSDEPKTYNYIREVRYAELLKELAAVALEHDIMFVDVHYVTEELRKKFAASFDRAVNVLWSGDDSQFDPAIPPLTYRTLLEADRIMKDKIKPNGND